MNQETKDVVRAIYQHLVKYNLSNAYCPWIYKHYEEAFFKPSALDFPQGMKYKKETLCLE